MRTAVFLSILFIASYIIYAYSPKKEILFDLEKITDKLESPVGIAYAPDGSGRLFILEQTGTIRILKNGKLLEKPFLDITKKLDSFNKFYSEKGLLGIAFHPNYRKNRRFFIYYSAPLKEKGFDHKSVLAEYEVSDNEDFAKNTEKVILEVKESENNHNGGQIAFGKDGFLYIGLGDGGGAGDQHGETGNGQSLNTLLGKILRIDVNKGNSYTIPKDNPFQGENEKPEIWAYGLRNPWRFSFDRLTGELYCGDVGQNQYEEVDIIEKGQNYGWRIMEGKHCYNPKNCNATSYKFPVFEYTHETGICIIGGYVYRKNKNSGYYGKYFFGDWNGKLFCIAKTSSVFESYTVKIKGQKDNDTGMRINTFGEDEYGNIYVAGQTLPGNLVSRGVLYKIKLD